MSFWIGENVLHKKTSNSRVEKNVCLSSRVGQGQNLESPAEFKALIFEEEKGDSSAEQDYFSLHYKHYWRCSGGGGLGVYTLPPIYTVHLRTQPSELLTCKKTYRPPPPHIWWMEKVCELPLSEMKIYIFFNLCLSTTVIAYIEVKCATLYAVQKSDSIGSKKITGLQF